MIALIVGLTLICGAIAVYCWARLPNRRATRRQREEALRRYARDVDADQ